MEGCNRPRVDPRLQHPTISSSIKGFVTRQRVKTLLTNAENKEEGAGRMFTALDNHHHNQDKLDIIKSWKEEMDAERAKEDAERGKKEYKKNKKKDARKRRNAKKAAEKAAESPPPSPPAKQDEEKSTPPKPKKTREQVEAEVAMELAKRKLLQSLHGIDYILHVAGMQGPRKSKIEALQKVHKEQYFSLSEEEAEGFLNETNDDLIHAYQKIAVRFLLAKFEFHEQLFSPETLENRLKKNGWDVNAVWEDWYHPISDDEETDVLDQFASAELDTITSSVKRVVTEMEQLTRKKDVAVDVPSLQLKVNEFIDLDHQLKSIGATKQAFSSEFRKDCSKMVRNCCMDILRGAHDDLKQRVEGYQGRVNSMVAKILRQNIEAVKTPMQQMESFEFNDILSLPQYQEYTQQVRETINAAEEMIHSKTPTAERKKVATQQLKPDPKAESFMQSMASADWDALQRQADVAMAVTRYSGLDKILSNLHLVVDELEVLLHSLQNTPAIQTKVDQFFRLSKEIQSTGVPSEELPSLMGGKFMNRSQLTLALCCGAILRAAEEDLRASVNAWKDRELTLAANQLLQEKIHQVNNARKQLKSMNNSDVESRDDFQELQVSIDDLLEQAQGLCDKYPGKKGPVIINLDDDLSDQATTALLKAIEKNAGKKTQVIEVPLPPATINAAENINHGKKPAAQRLKQDPKAVSLMDSMASADWDALQQQADVAMGLAPAERKKTAMGDARPAKGKKPVVIELDEDFEAQAHEMLRDQIVKNGGKKTQIIEVPLAATVSEENSFSNVEKASKELRDALAGISEVELDVEAKDILVGKVKSLQTELRTLKDSDIKSSPQFIEYESAAEKMIKGTTGFLPCGNGNCATSNPGLQRCLRCKSVSYCSGECQKNHWKDHKMECKKLAAGPQKSAGFDFSKALSVTSAKEEAAPAQDHKSESKKPASSPKKSGGFDFSKALSASSTKEKAAPKKSQGFDFGKALSASSQEEAAAAQDHKKPANSPKKSGGFDFSKALSASSTKEKAAPKKAKEEAAPSKPEERVFKPPAKSSTPRLVPLIEFNKPGSLAVEMHNQLLKLFKNNYNQFIIFEIGAGEQGTNVVRDWWRTCPQFLTKERMPQLKIISSDINGDIDVHMGMGAQQLQSDLFKLDARDMYACENMVRIICDTFGVSPASIVLFTSWPDHEDDIAPWYGDALINFQRLGVGHVLFWDYMYRENNKMYDGVPTTF